jgi:hypothetical protein
MSKDTQPLVAPLPATTPMIDIGRTFLSRSVMGPIGISVGPAVNHGLFERPPIRRRIANGPSQAEIARAMRAVKQVGGGFDVEVLSDRIRLAPALGGGPGAAPKTRKPRDFAL